MMYRPTMPALLPSPCGCRSFAEANSNRGFYTHVLEVDELDDLLKHEVEEVPGALGEDVREVSHYVDAMNHELDRIRGGFPLSNRLLREMHAILLTDGRGAQKQPGEFRRSQNWIGGTRPGNASFVPPPPQRLDECLGNLERSLHEAANPIVKAAIAHVQFGTIHPRRRENRWQFAARSGGAASQTGGNDS